MNSPDPDPTPAPQKITPDCQPVFPCWLWHSGNHLMKPKWTHSSKLIQSLAISPYTTHWLPDQPTAPTCTPSEGEKPVLGNSDDSSVAPADVKPETTEAAYWRGYMARQDELTAVAPESANPSLWRYLNNAHAKKITFHTIGVNRMPDGGFHFYIHPQAVSGDTEDYLIWPDPFSHSDMIVNRKDSPPPDLEKFKKFLATQFPK